MRIHPDEFEDREIELIYIAASVKEAQKVEALLDEHGIEYAIRVEQYRAGIIFASVRAGAFFYVLPDAAELSRNALTARGLRVIPG